MDKPYHVHLRDIARTTGAKIAYHTDAEVSETLIIKRVGVRDEWYDKKHLSFWKQIERNSTI
jgi:hypothetical protein